MNKYDTFFMQDPNSCELGCTDAYSFRNMSRSTEKNQHQLINSLVTFFFVILSPDYPFAANPIQPALVTQIGDETSYMINITRSIPSDLSDDLGYSTLIVRVQDKSSMIENDFTYYTSVSTIAIIS